jgi:hypothetical protein
VRRLLATVGVMLSCGRTPTIEPETFRVATVDNGDNPLRHAQVSLYDGERRLATRRTDADGMVTFTYPGAGRYRVHAKNDPECCWGDADVDVALTEPDEVVLVEVQIGPCPTYSPTWCS